MPRWSLLSGAPRVGDAPSPLGSPPGAGADEVTRHAQWTAWLASLLVLPTAGGLLAWLLDGRVAGETLALAGILPALLLAGVFLALHRAADPRGALARGALEVASALLAAGLVLAVAGHLLRAGGSSLRAWVLPFAGDSLGLGASGGVALAVVALLLAPLAAGLRVHALGLVLDATGKRAKGPAAFLAAAPARDADDLLARHSAGRVAAGFGARWLEGLRLPGLLGLDVLLSVPLALRPHRDRIHLAAEPEPLAEALRRAGCDVEATPTTLRVRLPAPEESALPSGRVEARWARFRFPRVEAADVLEVAGAPRDLRAFRALLESECASAALFAWSRPARRLERRLNALAREAEAAQTVEERSVVLDEMARLVASLAHRDLSGEERALLAAWKGNAFRLRLASRMLSEPPGARREGATLAPAPALAPALPRIMEAGGLSAVSRIVHVPHWVLPVQTPWGECEVVVNALQQAYDAAESEALLAALRRKGPALLLDAPRGAPFLPAPPPTAALLRTLRGGLPVHARPRAEAATGEAGVELFYVPFVETAEGHLDAVTGGRVALERLSRAGAPRGAP